MDVNTIVEMQYKHPTEQSLSQYQSSIWFCAGGGEYNAKCRINGSADDEDSDESEPSIGKFPLQVEAEPV